MCCREEGLRSLCSREEGLRMCAVGGGAEDMCSRRRG